MTEYFPKSEQIDTLNGKLDALNETLKKREDFVSAVAKMEAATADAQTATSAANTAATNANTAAAGVVSPTATVTKSGTTTTVTVTDKTGTTTAEVKDGSDATVTKKAIVDALGYEPQKPEGNYELIEEITLTEDTSEIVRTQEPDGTAYHFGGIVVISYVKSTINNDYIRLHGSKGNYITFGRASSSVAYEQRLTLKIVNGMIDFSGSNQASNNSYALHRGGAGVLYTSHFNNNWIDKIKITADGAMIAGGTIKIYASRRS